MNSTSPALHYRVLYVEDNAANARLISSALKIRPDIELLIETTGMMGLKAAQQHTPDLILLDINLPDMSGIQILHELKQLESSRHTPVIAVSANAMPHDIESGLKAGFDNYLVKPVNIKTLLDHLQCYLPSA